MACIFTNKSIKSNIDILADNINKAFETYLDFEPKLHKLYLSSSKIKIFEFLQALSSKFNEQLTAVTDALTEQFDSLDADTKTATKLDKIEELRDDLTKLTDQWNDLSKLGDEQEGRSIKDRSSALTDKMTQQLDDSLCGN